ncbi:MAG: cation transporter [Elusimicrobia bacterium]|nr:cation transporter [Elusimicrobiota bacterium]
MESLYLIRRSLIIAVGLAGLKLTAGLLTHSMGVMASALDSVMDLCSSAVNFVSLKYSRDPADKEHPYGHGKAEGLAGLFQSAFIGLSGLWVVAESLRRMIWGAKLAIHWSAIAVMVFAALLSIFHGWQLKKAGEKEHSPILRAEALHFSMDMLTNFGVIAALGAAHWTGHLYWDIAASLAIAGYVLYEAYGIFRSSVSELMDEGLSDEMIAQITRIIDSHHPNVVGFHNFRSRKAGNRHFIDFHIDIRGVESFRQAHDITENLIAEVKGRVPNADVTVHYDPEGER